MRHDEARAALHEPLERLLDLDLGPRVDVARGFVEDEHGGVGEHGAGYAEQLPLPGRDRGLLAVEHRVIAMREPLDELVCKGGPRRGLDLLVRASGRPSVRFSLTVALLTHVSWSTMPKLDLRLFLVTSRMSWPSMAMVPASTS